MWYPATNLRYWCVLSRKGVMVLPCIEYRGCLFQRSVQHTNFERRCPKHASEFEGGVSMMLDEHVQTGFTVEVSAAREAH